MERRYGPEDSGWSRELSRVPQLLRCPQTRECHCEKAPLDLNPLAHLCRARHTHHQTNHELAATDAAVYLRIVVVLRSTACVRSCRQQLCALLYVEFDRAVLRRDTIESFHPIAIVCRQAVWKCATEFQVQRKEIFLV